MSAASLKLVETIESPVSKSAPAKSPKPRKEKAAPSRAKKRAPQPKSKKREACAADVMTSPAISCSVHGSLNDAARLMWENDLGAIVVVDEHHCPVGMLTDRDISMAAYTQGLPLFHSAVTSAMSRSLVQARTTTTVEELCAMMANSGVRRVPVVDESGRLSGVVGLANLLSESLAAVPKERKRATTSAVFVKLLGDLLAPVARG